MSAVATAALTDKRALDLIKILDEASNLWGPQRPEQRARIYKAAANPCEETWEEAHCIIIDSESYMTLWQAVLGFTSYAVKSKPLDDPWPVVPTGQQIVLALREALG